MLTACNLYALKCAVRTKFAKQLTIHFQVAFLHYYFCIIYYCIKVCLLIWVYCLQQDAQINHMGGEMTSKKIEELHGLCFHNHIRYTFFIIHGYMFIKRILYYSCFGLVWYSHLTMKEERRDGRKLISHFGNICTELQLVIATNIRYHLSQICVFYIIATIIH